MRLVPLALLFLYSAAAIAEGSLLVRRGEALVLATGGPAVSVPFRIETVRDDVAGELSLRSRDSGATWNVALTAADCEELRALVVPPGAYEVAVHLDHHRLGHLTLEAEADGAEAPVVMHLAAAPVIRGVVRAGGVPLAGVRVTPEGAGGTATTDGQGRFAIEVAARWPGSLKVARAGFGTTSVRVPEAVANVELPAVELARAATLRVSVVRRADKGPIDAELTVADAIGGEPRVVAAKRLGASGAVTFDDVAPGSYLVVLRGDEPFEGIGRTVGLAAGDRRALAIELPVHFVTARFTRGGAPFAGARVTAQKSGSGWRTAFIASAAGEVKSAVWETGTYHLGIRDDPAHAPFMTRLVLDGVGISKVSVDIPNRRLRGRVVDPSEAPVAEATVVLRATSPGLPTLRTQTDANGVFAYSAVHAGPHELRVVSPGFLRPDPLPVALAESDTVREVEVRLERGALRTVEVVHTRGGPIGGALVVCATGQAIRSTAYTDARGQALVAAPPGDAELYVFPAEGSFAMGTLRGGEVEPVQLAVPPGSASLEIETLTIAGAPLPDVELIMAFNGERLPPEIAREMRAWQGNQLRTGERGSTVLHHIPPGTYELWPYRGDAEAAAILDAALSAPIRVNVLTGPNKATVRFRARG